ncbi:uncharacterized protein LOC117078470 [Trachypithecus francoisi]|uniref:uncharacterized protein LOC117078470 n=1 Tax=Trachypithecus francoisi TaxID=54180 RepID=UPI00141AD5DE|nr:uncharacterized protein LOC117078470 [Trachypithecus francoisi]
MTGSRQPCPAPREPGQEGGRHASLDPSPLSSRLSTGPCPREPCRESGTAGPSLSHLPVSLTPRSKAGLETRGQGCAAIVPDSACPACPWGSAQDRPRGQASNWVQQLRSLSWSPSLVGELELQVGWFGGGLPSPRGSLAPGPAHVDGRHQRDQSWGREGSQDSLGGPHSSLVSQHRPHWISLSPSFPCSPGSVGGAGGPQLGGDPVVCWPAGCWPTCVSGRASDPQERCCERK